MPECKEILKAIQRISKAQHELREGDILTAYLLLGAGLTSLSAAAKEYTGLKERINREIRILGGYEQTLRDIAYKYEYGQVSEIEVGMLQTADHELELAINRLGTLYKDCRGGQEVKIE